VAGDALKQSVSLLAPYGRFIEVGHVSVAGIEGLPITAFDRNQLFAAVDIDLMLNERPSLIQRLIKDINKGFEEDYFHAPPVKTFAAKDAAEAFNYMIRSKQIGKIVVTIQDEEVPVVPLSDDKEIILKDGTYLITGGHGGFGLEIAQWLANRGAGQLVLASRKGSVSDDARKTIDAMKQAGAQVMSVAVDISNRLQVEKLIKEIKAGLPPLRGIFHCAMVLDDGRLADLDKNRFSKVMAPKVAGALHLHEFTNNIPLDCFVLFSSISSIIGNIGQANYIAANAFLDAFAHYRRSLGLPATAINWGVFSETGVAARHAHLTELFKSGGITGFTTEQALLALERVREINPAQIGVFSVNWNQWSSTNPTAAKSSRFQGLVETYAFDQNGEGTAKKTALIEELTVLEQAAKQHHMESILCEQIANVLRFPADKINIHQGIDKLGIDSLMALELALAFKTEWGITISVEDLIKQSSIAQLSTQILNRILPISC
jgi:NADP-dependent 3-hydroxy acid dehydrogenase YdfG/acyl carrier protein